MIAITGSTGQLGTLVIEALLKKVAPSKIVALARDTAKAASISKSSPGVTVRRADYNDPSSFDSALQGVTKLLLISSSEVGQRGTQHRAVIDAAKRTGVKLIAYTSILHADTSPLGLAIEHRDTEAALRASGVPFVLLRNGWYTENYTAALAGALERGAIAGSAGDGRISSAARKDYADAAAAVLATEGHEGKIYELAGDESYSLAELAAEVGRQAGKTVHYADMPAAAYKSVLLGAGLPEPIAELLADSDAGAAKGALFDDGHALSQLIKHPTTPLSDVVRAALG